MNKFIRFSFWLIFLVGALILVLAFTEPNDVTVTRSITIKAPRGAVFQQLTNFSNWQQWCTLFRNDTSAKITYSGSPGQAGSAMEWKGDEGNIGEGIIKNEAMDSTSMHYTFVVTKPGSMNADGVLAVKDSGDYTKVSWTFHKHFPFLANAVLVVFDLDKYMGGDFERSLANLKKYIETDVEPLVEIREVEYTGGMIAGIRDTVQWSDLSTFFGDTYNLFVKTPPERITGAPVGLFYDWDTVNKRTDVVAGMPVTDTDIPVNGIIFSQVTPSKAIKAVLKGDYSGAKRIHDALDKYLAAKGLTKWLTIEEYVVYPGNERDSRKWVTNIYALIQ